MSKELAEKALRRIMEYEGGDLSDIGRSSRAAEAEYGYIVTDGEVQKVIGTHGEIAGEKFEGIDFKDVVFWHTHPTTGLAELSPGDVVFALTNYEMDGIGVIGEGGAYSYWETSKTIAKELLKERERIVKEWNEALKKGDEAKATGDTATFERCVAITFSCRGKTAANTKKARAFALTEVLTKPRYYQKIKIVEEAPELVNEMKELIERKTRIFRRR